MEDRQVWEGLWGCRVLGMMMGQEEEGGAWGLVLRMEVLRSVLMRVGSGGVWMVGDSILTLVVRVIDRALAWELEGNVA